MRRHRQIALLGYPGVGKSSLAHHFVYQRVNQDYDPNIKTNLEYQFEVNGYEYDLQIVDNAGLDEYTLNHIDLENSDAYILVYSIDDLQSFKIISKIRDKLYSTSAINKIPIVLVANKIDRIQDRIISFDEGQYLADQWNIPFIEISALDIKSVEEVFKRTVKTMDNLDENVIQRKKSIEKQRKTSINKNKSCLIS